MRDDIDYVPTNRFVLWGHHFTAVAGAAPIIGPGIAVIWGWLPAFLWVVIGTMFFCRGARLRCDLGIHPQPGALGRLADR